MATKKTRKKEIAKKPTPTMLDDEAVRWMYIAMAMTRVDHDLAINIFCRIIEAESGAEIAKTVGRELSYDAERLVKAARKARAIGDLDGGVDDEDAFYLYDLALAWQKREAVEVA